LQEIEIMGRMRKKYNWKARLQPETAKESEKSTPSLDHKDVIEKSTKDEEYSKSHDDTNILVTSSKKNKVKVTHKDPNEKRKNLTKKQRKKLEKIVETKRKKAKRAELLKALSEHAVSDKELAQMSSTTDLGQLNITRKRKLSEDDSQTDTVERGIVSSIRRGRKKGKKLRLEKKAHESVPAKITKEAEEEFDSEESSESDDENSNSQRLAEKNQGMESIHSNRDVATECTDKEKLKSELSDSRKAFKAGANEVKVEKFVQSKDETVAKNVAPTKPESEPAIFKEVKRDPEIQAARLQLPILGEEQAVMEAIHDNDVVILCGETGSGKTTQVPQFLYEGGYTTRGLIGVTEPRRVAAVTMSRRVALELNMSTELVSYQIRYEGNVTEKTIMKFMTDGVLLKEIEKDFFLSKYSVIVIDEAHERSVFTDILMGLLSRIVPMRKSQGKQLKLVIMSATLRVEDFTGNARLFPSPPPVVTVESRQFPVTVHFNKRTPDDYLNEAFRKVCKIHRTLPPGGILVFVTGQTEVHGLCKKLKKTFPHNSETTKSTRVAEEKVKDENSDDDVDDDFDLDNYPVNPAVEDRDAEDEDLGEDIANKGDESSGFDLDDSAFSSLIDKNLPMFVLPLYSLLSSQQQAKVFQPPPEGTRLCVVATNVAETSLTIPNIKYVVDTGMVKRRYYDKVTGVSSFKITWTSRASADQRAGRAGRVEPGHCYRLYSSAVFTNEFEEFSAPEISRRPVDDLVLQMKDMSIDKVVNFPFPTPPDATALQSAEKLLLNLGALEERKTVKGNVNAVITPLGRAMAKFPVSPRYAKMLCLGHQESCMEYVIAIVSALTVKEIFADDNDREAGQITKEDRRKISRLRRTWAGQGDAQKLGDAMVLLRAVGASEYAGCTEKFCSENGLRHKGMIEIRKLRVQLTNSVNLVNADARVVVNPRMSPPSPVQCKALRQICLSGLGDHVARKSPAGNNPQLKNSYSCMSVDEPVFIHPSSALFDVLPEFVIYQEVVKTSKLFIKGVIAVQPDWIPVLVPSICTFSKPLEDPAPRYDSEAGVVKCHMTCTFGPKSWQVPAQELEYPTGLDKYKWFGKFLLEGRVVAALSKFVPFLLGAPVTMIKSWAKLQPRTEVLLSELVSGSANSKMALMAAWKKNPKFLLAALKQWIPESKHVELTSMWPPKE